jgi:hypothetical protein
VHPSVPEQLAGLRRILADVVAPEVVDPYPTDILAGVMAAMEGLERGWYEVPRYLRWDADATADLLMAARPDLDQELGKEIATVCSASLSDPLDLRALEAHHERLRALLARAAPAINAHPELHERLAELFKQRAQRFPFGLIAQRPSS